VAWAVIEGVDPATGAKVSERVVPQ
jgi:hypothetical protein